MSSTLWKISSLNDLIICIRVMSWKRYCKVLDLMEMKVQRTVLEINEIKENKMAVIEKVVYNQNTAKSH